MHGEFVNPVCCALLWRFGCPFPLVDNACGHVRFWGHSRHRHFIPSRQGMFLDLTRGHWLTMYRNRFPAGAPPLEMRVMTRDRRDVVTLADDVPNYAGHSGRFMLRLVVAWIAMGFRRPEVTLGKTVRKSH